MLNIFRFQYRNTSVSFSSRFFTKQKLNKHNSIFFSLLINRSNAYKIKSTPNLPNKTFSSNFLSPNLSQIKLDTLQNYIDTNQEDKAKIFLKQILPSISSPEDFKNIFPKIKDLSFIITQYLRLNENFSESIEVYKIILDTIKRNFEFKSDLNSFSNQINKDLKIFYLEINLSCAVDYLSIEDYENAIKLIKENISFLTVQNSSILLEDSLYAAYLVLNLFNLAYIKFKMDLLEEYQSILKDCLEIYEKRVRNNLNSPQFEKEDFIKLEIGRLLKFIQNYKEANFVFLNCLHIEEERADSNLSNVFILYREIIDCYFKLHDLKKCKEVLELFEAKVIAIQLSNASNLITSEEIKKLHMYFYKLYENLAKEFFEKGNNLKESIMTAEKSEYYLEKFLSEISLREKSKEMSKASTYILLANIYEANEDFEKSIQYSLNFLRSVDKLNLEDEKDVESHIVCGNKFGLNLILRKEEKLFYIGSVYYLVAKCYYKMDKLQNSKDYLKMCNEFFKSETDNEDKTEKISMPIFKYLEKYFFSNPELILELMMKMAILNKDLNNYSESLENFSYVINNTKNHEDAISSYYNKALIYYELKEFKRCEENILALIKYTNDQGIRLKEAKMKELYEILMKPNNQDR